MRHASTIADNVNYITTAIRVDVQQVSQTVAAGERAAAAGGGLSGGADQRAQCAARGGAGRSGGGVRVDRVDDCVACERDFNEAFDEEEWSSMADDDEGRADGWEKPRPRCHDPRRPNSDDEDREQQYDLLTAALLGATIGAGVTLLLRRGRAAVGRSVR